MTNSLDGARDHARAQAAATTTTARTIPSRTEGDDVVWDELVPGGGYATRVLPAGAILRITDVDGDGCVQLLVYNARNPVERLNVMDTVKVQWQAYLAAGALLLSDMGRVLMTIVDDTSARHDCLCGGSNLATNTDRYGDGGASGPAPNARDLLCLGAAKHGLGRADVGPCINLFKGARVGDDGSLTLDGEPAPATGLELRAEMPVLVVAANTSHPLDDRPAYTVTPVRFTAREAAPPDPATNRWRTTSPERTRAFENTDELLLTAP